MTLAAFAVVFLGGALASIPRVGAVHLQAPYAFWGALATATIAALAAALPLPYALRAFVAALAGGAPLAMAAGRMGPLARLGDEGTRAAAAMAVMATILPAALLFRARYRAFRAARVILFLALVASAPALLLFAKTALDTGGTLGDRGIAVAGLLVAALATLGFMGPETSAGCSQWASLVVGVYTARPTWRALSVAWSGRDVDLAPLGAAALGALIASSLVAFGLYQLLAAALAGRARTVNVHRPVGPSASDPGSRFNSGFED